MTTETIATTETRKTAQQLIQDAQSQGALLRTSPEYKSHVFVGGETVVSELGTVGTVLTVNKGRPSTIMIQCQITGNNREIHSQDFFQVVHDGTPEAARQAKKLGLGRQGTPGVSAPRAPSSTSDRKVVMEAFSLGVLTQAQLDEALAKLDEADAAAKLEVEKAKAEKRAAKLAEQEARKAKRAEDLLSAKKAKLLADMQARGLALPSVRT